MTQIIDAFDNCHRNKMFFNPDLVKNILCQSI